MYDISFNYDGIESCFKLFDESIYDSTQKYKNTTRKETKKIRGL